MWLGDLVLEYFLCICIGWFSDCVFRCFNNWKTRCLCVLMIGMYGIWVIGWFGVQVFWWLNDSMTEWLGDLMFSHSDVMVFRLLSADITIFLVGYWVGKCLGEWMFTWVCNRVIQCLNKLMVCRTCGLVNTTLADGNLLRNILQAVGYVICGYLLLHWYLILHSLYDSL